MEAKLSDLQQKEEKLNMVETAIVALKGEGLLKQTSDVSYEPVRSWEEKVQIVQQLQEEHRSAE
jgi:hypothetical protein